MTSSLTRSRVPSVRSRDTHSRVVECVSNQSSGTCAFLSQEPSRVAPPSERSSFFDSVRSLSKLPLVRKRRRRKSTRHALRRAPWGAGRVARPRRPRTASTRLGASWTSLRPVDRHARALAARTRVRTRRRQLIRVRRDVPSAPPATTARSGGAAWTVGLPATFRRRARSDGAARSPRRTRWRPRRRRRCRGRRVSPSPPKATTEMRFSRNETSGT